MSTAYHGEYLAHLLPSRCAVRPGDGEPTQKVEIGPNREREERTLSTIRWTTA